MFSINIYKSIRWAVQQAAYNRIRMKRGGQMGDKVEQLMRFVPYIIGDENIQIIMHRVIRFDERDLRHLRGKMESRKQEERLKAKESDAQ